jgi:hypothetical protein
MYKDESLNERAVRSQMKYLFKAFLSENTFMVGTATHSLKKWLLEPGRTAVERQATWSATKNILMEMERRIRWIRDELDKEVFKRTGG